MSRPDLNPYPQISLRAWDLDSYPIFRPAWRVRWQVEPHDLWIGAYWRREVDEIGTLTTVWICVLPCLPLLIQHWKA